MWTSRDAAARADRRAFDVRHLRLRARNLVGDRGRRRRAIANREAADLAGGAQVALHQRRRHRLRVGDVVEAVADGVGRQERVDVDVDVEQIADGARVFGAVGALERTRARIRRRGPRARSIRDSMLPARSTSAVPSGRLAPGGGIMPTRMRRTMRSAVCATSGSANLAASKAANDRPPGLARSLWQVAQYCLTIAVCCSAVISPAGGRRAARAALRRGHLRCGSACCGCRSRCLPRGAGAVAAACTGARSLSSNAETETDGRQSDRGDSRLFHRKSVAIRTKRRPA